MARLSFFLGLAACLDLIWLQVHCALVNPLEDTDILKAYRVPNHQQCQRLCWYWKDCARFSFYDKNDFAERTAANCVLHGSDGQNQELVPGWRERKASGDDVTNRCAPRPCVVGQLCLPIRGVSNDHVCTNVTAESSQSDGVQICPELSTLMPGLLVDPATGRNPGDTATLTCDPSQFQWYPAAANDTVTCLPSFQWSVPLGECRPFEIYFSVPTMLNTTLPQPIYNTQEACFSGRFDGPDQMTLQFKSDSEEALLEVFFRNTYAADPALSDAVSWSFLQADGVRSQEANVGQFALQPGLNFNLTIHLFYHLMTVSLDNTAILAMNFDSANSPDLAGITRISFLQASLSYVSFVSICYEGEY